ncbi:MAG: Clp protease ClpP [Bacteroidota bacterium]
MAKEIIIDSYIGPGYYSKKYVRAMLNNAKGKDVTAKISSLGGDLNHAVDIHDQFAEHGKVTVEYTGFNASSGTIVSLGAFRIKISRNSYYLIHKVSSWIDEYGYKNEDDLEKLISDLSKEKDENKKITLNVAKMYIDRTGKTIKEIIDLMKKETWLTADEALEWGFVDEIYDPKNKVNFLENKRMVAMINAAGYPVPERKSQKSNTMSDKKNDFAKDEKSFSAWLKEKFGISPKEKENNNDTDEPIDQDARIIELEAKVAKLEEDPKPKENTEDPEKAKKIAELEAKIAKLEDPADPKKKTEEKPKENKTEPTEKEARIVELENQIKTLKNSSVADPDVSKSNDKNKTDKPGEFSNAVDEAKEMMDYLESE